MSGNRIALQRVEFVDNVAGPGGATPEKIYQHEHVRTSDIQRGRATCLLWMTADQRWVIVEDKEGRHAPVEVPVHRVHMLVRKDETRRTPTKSAEGQAADAVGGGKLS